jgi:hypothetical protein
MWKIADVNVCGHMMAGVLAYAVQCKLLTLVSVRHGRI